MLSLVGALYIYIPVHTPRIAKNAELYSVSVDRRYFTTIAICYFAASDASYDAVHLTRELVQTALLTYQTYKASYLVAVPWMNNTLVILLVLNCWSTPLIHTTFGSHLFRARLFGIAMNVALDLMMYLVIPVVLFIPYYERVDAIAGSYASNDFWYTDRWLMRVLTEWKMLFVTSLADGISKCVVTLSITVALLEMPRLVVPRRTVVNPAAMSSRNADTSAAMEFERILGEIDAPWLSYLVIRHCSYVEITPAFQQLTHLQGFKLFNSTLARWREDAALTRKHHPAALFVFLANVNMTEFPRGLHSPDFPTALMDIEICQSNLSTLPPEVALAWPKGMYLLLEGIQFTSFPDVLTQLQPQSLSLVRSSISAAPAALFESPRLEWLKLSGTSLSVLPSSVSMVPRLRFFFFQSTEIATLPPWMNLDVIFEAQGGNTPLCAALEAGSSALSDDATRFERLRRVVNCTQTSSCDALYHFPITRELINNP
ncbi:hypothetical protein P43SY_007961 [Pythium insidiosum]|uniref:TKL protein kinase n=1 Tax=Pythium insidiosum TaxID=114742 RepID=A0AAD5Q781_PYTIN|nr:hypothetical protein P43SY_007961 [Pythium insidiosum]